MDSNIREAESVLRCAGDLSTKESDSLLKLVAIMAADGYATGGMVDPSTAETAGIVGALLPPALKGMNLAGTALARPSAASQVPESVLQAARAGREAGYVIPPTQVRPTLANRAVEGMAGKLSTAQNASAMNQPVTNRLAASAIGADDLTAESIAAVRAKANSAYDALGRAGAFQADDTFRDALQRAGGASQQLRKDFSSAIRP
jgi:hypothetical protein